VQVRPPGLLDPDVLEIRLIDPIGLVGDLLAELVSDAFAGFHARLEGEILDAHDG